MTITLPPLNGHTTARATLTPAEAGREAGRVAGPQRLLPGRLSRDGSGSSWQTLPGMATVLPPPESTKDWQLLQLDTARLQDIDPSKLLELLADLSPDVSRALFDFLRLCNPGVEIHALKVGTADQDDEAQAALDAFLGRLTEHYGSTDVVWNRLYLAAFLRGAFLGELVLAEGGAGGRVPVDLATPDPAVMRFRREIDPARGGVWVLCQWQGGELKDLDRPTIRYVPVDPMPGVPYGRALAAPALFTTLFLLGILHDLKRVVQQQGYPRLDFSISTEGLLAQMPPEYQTDPDHRREWVNAAVQMIKDEYALLAPDDAFVHSDVVTVNRPVGAAGVGGGGALSEIGRLIEVLERMSVRALKTMPLAMGTTDGVSEANANRQWELLAAGVKSIQHSAENLLQHLFTLALQAQGIVATVEVRFAELRASEEFRDQGTLRLKIENQVRMRNEGWIEQDEASLSAAGHPAVEDAPAPVAPMVAAPADAVPDPGANR